MPSSCKTLLSFFLTITTSLIAIPIAYSKDADWYAFSMARELEASSPANMGKLILDAPAGKHGFVKTNGDVFVFENGDPAKFWGTNLCFSANFPSKEEAVILADRIAFFGFNAVRFHHMDFYFSPNGILRDVKPSETNPFRKVTHHLNPQQLDRMDYLISELKKRGIYVNLNLLVSRRFTQADGVPGADRLDIAAKPVSLFDPKIIALQKKYAYDLLTHTNKYTGLRYCDDPAIVMVEITNENSLFNYWAWGRLDRVPLKKDVLPEIYLDLLDKKWNAWLREQYGTPQAVQETLGLKNKATAENFNFSRPFHQPSHQRAEASLEAVQKFYVAVEREYFDEMISYLKNSIGLRIPVTGVGGPAPQDVEALGTSDFIDRHVYWDHPTHPAGWNLNNFKIHNRSMLTDKKLGIAGDISSDWPEGKPRTVTEWNHSYPNPYAYETPVLVAAQALRSRIGALFQFSFSHDDLTPSKLSTINNYFDTIANPQKLLLTAAGGLLFLQEDKVASDVKEGIFKIESPSLVGASGKIAGKKMVFPSASFETGLDGAVFIFSADQKNISESTRLILITMGNVKNNGAGWHNNRKFVWGEAPIFLQNLQARVSIATKTHSRVYELDPAGSRDREIPSIYENGLLSFSTKDSKTPWFEITQVPQTPS